MLEQHSEKVKYIHCKFGVATILKFD